MVKTQKAFTISLASAIVIAFIYWALQSVIISIPFWLVGLIIFLVSFIGMKWKEWI